MNIIQTRQVMAYIWATHPSAPKYTDDDKARTIASYFRVLYKYDINDVLEAIDIICRESPTFIPSAYEIEARCTKHVDIKRFIPEEYYEVGRRLEAAEQRKHELEQEYNEAFQERVKLLNGVIMEFYNEEQKAELELKVAPLNAVIDKYHDWRIECYRLRSLHEELYQRALAEAYDAYDRTQAQLAHNDLCLLGYERLALEK